MIVALAKSLALSLPSTDSCSWNETLSFLTFKMETSTLVNQPLDPLQTEGSYLYEPLTDIRLEEDVFEPRPPFRSEDLEDDSTLMDVPEETHDQTSHYIVRVGRSYPS